MVSNFLKIFMHQEKHFTHGLIIRNLISCAALASGVGKLSSPRDNAQNM